MPLDADALQAENEQLLDFLYACPVGLVQFDEAGAVGMMNPLALQLLFPIAPVVTNLFDVLGSCAPEIRNLVESFAETRGTICENYRVVVGQGEEQSILACTVIKIEAGRIMAVLTDISQQVAQERRLKQAESWFSAIMTGVNDFALFALDANGRINGWNQSGQRQTGFTDRDVLGRTLNAFLFPDEAIQGRALEQVDFARRDGWHIDEGWRRRKDGSRYWAQSLVAALKEDNGQVAGFSVVLRDVTEKKVSGDQIKRLMTTDHLTGVANRARFFELAEAEAERWKRLEQPLSAIMLDADHFKSVNDTYGHPAGDAVLKALATTCRGMLRSVDIMGRLGGEEFAIVLPSIDLEATRLVAERLRGAIQGLKVEAAGHVIGFTASFGCATMGGPVTNVSKLLQAADDALYRAKQGGRNRVEVHAPIRAVA
ncbi:MAG TPA: diguanylate cyclase [Beijerinckiaceae bacterium]